ncbi:SsrA-binding protein [Candidatus Protochlamydia amoebophila]|uniref:SsrA-binding protein SmpB n=1 Tax=Candidatus Protochlamydia amoebophila TaxID=362787 RepID=UPI001BC9D3F6|nr:SsrA-binding protein SmpB [Candidatus Protochlamydia amoebophila]MBS4163609.1 SsrA-binding protein [Candidatus Protochlamydia amoebophila]
MKDKHSDLVSNRRATHDYEILETFETGIVLQGTEIKSIRDHGATLQDAYVKVIHNELWLIGCNIAHYRFGNIHNHEEKRDRKLLMHKREIKKCKGAIQEKGLALIPLALYLKQGRIKARIAIAKGKKSFDKRADLKERDDKRQMQQAIKQQQY